MNVARIVAMNERARAGWRSARIGELVALALAFDMALACLAWAFASAVLS